MRARVTILILDNTDFQTKIVTRDPKKDIMTKGQSMKKK